MAEDVRILPFTQYKSLRSCPDFLKMIDHRFLKKKSIID